MPTGEEPFYSLKTNMPTAEEAVGLASVLHLLELPDYEAAVEREEELTVRGGKHAEEAVDRLVREVPAIGHRRRHVEV